MLKTLDRTKDIFLDTMLLGNEILTKKIKTTNKTKITVILAAYRNVERLEGIIKDLYFKNFNKVIQKNWFNAVKTFESLLLFVFSY